MSSSGGTPFRRRAAAVLALALPLLGLLGAGAGAQSAGPQDLVLSAPVLTPDRALALVATVPPLLSGRDLPAASFTATQAGRAVPVTSSRVLDGLVEVLLVVDPSGGQAALAARQSAAADLLRALPSQVPVTVLPPGDRTTARSALGTVADLAPADRPLLDGLPEPPAVRRLVVVLAGCRALQTEQRALPGGDTDVSVLADGGPCDDAAARVAGPARGTVRTGLDGTGLLAGVDAVARRLQGQYALRTGPGLGPEPVEVTVRVGEAVAAASLPLPGGASPSPSSASPSAGGATPTPSAPATPRAAPDADDDGVPVGPAVAATLLASAASAALVGEVLARRRAAQR